MEYTGIKIFSSLNKQGFNFGLKELEGSFKRFVKILKQ